MTVNTEHLSRRTKLMYGIGDAGINLADTMVGLLFAIFLTDVVGLRPGLAAIALFLGRTSDYLNDPIIGYCWPSVLAPLLSHYTPDFVQRLLEGIDAVLVEFPDLPDTWQLYGRRELVGLLCRLGFELKPVEEGA